MSALGEAYGNHAAPHEFKLRDSEGVVTKTYTLRLIDDEVKSALEKRIFERARDILFSLRTGMTEEMYERRLNKLADDYMEGFFSPFTSEEGQKYLKSNQGALQLMALIFQCSEAEVASLGGETQNHTEIQALIRIVLQESFRGIDMKKVDQQIKDEEAGKSRNGSATKPKSEGEPAGNSQPARTPAGLRV